MRREVKWALPVTTAVGLGFITDEVQGAIVEACRKAMSASLIDKLLGAPGGTFMRWMGKGAAEVIVDDATGSVTPMTPHAVLFVKCQQAYAEGISAKLDAIEKIGLGQCVSKEVHRTYKDGGESTSVTYTRPEWAALAWTLDRQVPDEFGQARRLNVQGEVKLNVTVSDNWRGGVSGEEALAKSAAIDAEVLDADFTDDGSDHPDLYPNPGGG